MKAVHGPSGKSLSRLPTLRKFKNRYIGGAYTMALNEITGRFILG